MIASGDPLVAFDVATGKERWVLESGAVPGAPMLVGNGTLYLASGKYDGTVAGYDPASGRRPGAAIWARATGSRSRWRWTRSRCMSSPRYWRTTARPGPM